MNPCLRGILIGAAIALGVMAILWGVAQLLPL